MSVASPLSSGSRYTLVPACGLAWSSCLAIFMNSSNVGGPAGEDQGVGVILRGDGQRGGPAGPAAGAAGGAASGGHAAENLLQVGGLVALQDHELGPGAAVGHVQLGHQGLDLVHVLFAGRDDDGVAGRLGRHGDGVLGRRPSGAGAGGRAEGLAQGGRHAGGVGLVQGDDLLAHGTDAGDVQRHGQLADLLERLVVGADQQRAALGVALDGDPGGRAGGPARPPTAAKGRTARGAGAEQPGERLGHRGGVGVLQDHRPHGQVAADGGVDVLEQIGDLLVVRLAGADDQGVAHRVGADAQRGGRAGGAGRGARRRPRGWIPSSPAATGPPSGRTC